VASRCTEWGSRGQGRSTSGPPTHVQSASLDQPVKSKDVYLCRAFSIEHLLTLKRRLAYLHRTPATVSTSVPSRPAMDGHTSPNGTSFDVLIIGSGLSGINSAYRLQESLPDANFAILEARHELGGTWSQFRYPGVRSDSDLHTLGFQFYPWRAKNPIASGASIMAYLHETAQTFDLEKKIRYGHKVVAADWRSEEQRWRVDVQVHDFGSGETRRVVYRTKWIITGTGYYNYDEPLKTNIPGIEKFQGKVVHPQFWPQHLDYQGKKIIVVGSGATTITLLPAMVETGVGSVTQLQRSPSYILSLPQDDEVWCERWAPEWFTLRYKRMFFQYSLTNLKHSC
jgi:cation diffusion facilitator CzcD-associated flavoprotein CzcO